MDVKQEKRIDDNLEYRWVTRLVRSLDRFHTIYSGKKKPPDGYMWSGERLTEKTAYIQARSFMARNLENNGKKHQAEGKAKVGRMRRLHLENARKIAKGIYFIDAEDKEFKETIKDARK